jgi:hypothetical protein
MAFKSPIVQKIGVCEYRHTIKIALTGRSMMKTHLGSGECRQPVVDQSLSPKTLLDVLNNIARKIVHSFMSPNAILSCPA